MKKLEMTIFLSILFISSYSQTFDLPNISELLESVNAYYNELTISQQQENKETTKYNWLHYIPSPSYSPFTGGFGINVNIIQPLQQIAIRNAKKQRNETIKRLNDLQSMDLKTQITYQYKSIQVSIEEFYQHRVIDSLKAKSFNLSQKQYQRNDITPTEFLTQQQAYELHKLQRINEENTIKKSIFQILINAKKAVTANNDFSENTFKP